MDGLKNMTQLKKKIIYMPGNIFQEIKIQYTFEITDGIKQSHSKKIIKKTDACSSRYAITCMCRYQESFLLA